MTLHTEPSLTHEFNMPLGRLPEPDSRSAERPYEPTPLVISLAKERQAVIRNQMLDILENHRPEYIGDELYRFIEIIYMSREANRDVKNSESYSTRLFSESSIDNPLICEAIDKAKYGIASVEELLVVAQALGMQSIELAKLTHIYGYRLEYIDDMRQDISRAIKLSGGEEFSGSDTKENFSLISFDGGITNSSRPRHGLVMRRKRTIGRVDGYDIYERSSFVVNLDKESGTKISPNLLKYIKGYEINAKNDKNLHGKPIWSQDIMANSSLEYEVSACIDSNDFLSVIPISTTVYAHGPAAEGLHKTLKEEERRKNREEMELKAPEISSMQNLQPE